MGNYEDVPTTDRLRADIDDGMTADKVRNPDPALAPLGTDDEAAGTTPTPLQNAMEQEARRNLPTLPHRKSPVLLYYVAAISAVAIAIIALLYVVGN